MGKTVGCRPASRHDRGDHPARSPTTSMKYQGFLAGKESPSSSGTGSPGRGPRWRRQFCEDIRGGLDPRFSGVDAPVLLKGYFFSEEYFVDQAEDIRSAFAEATPAVTEFVCQCEERAKGRPLVGRIPRRSRFRLSGVDASGHLLQSALAALPLPRTEYFHVVFGDDRELNVARASHLLGPLMALSRPTT